MAVSDPLITTKDPLVRLPVSSVLSPFYSVLSAMSGLPVVLSPDIVPSLLCQISPLFSALSRAVGGW